MVSRERVVPRPVFGFVVFLVATATVVFASAGTLTWLAGWLYLAVLSAAVASVSFGVFKNAPDLVQERKTAARSAKPWDRVLVPLMSGLPFAAVVVAGLGKRFGWAAPFPSWSLWPALLAMTAGAGLTYWGMRSNRFFSSHVRIQTERGHHVVDTGPYSRLRHPGYAGSLLVTLGTPILLDSAPAFALALLAAAVTVLRTALEDRTLRRELPGYADYARRVRWRLVPFVW